MIHITIIKIIIERIMNIALIINSIISVMVDITIMNFNNKIIMNIIIIDDITNFIMRIAIINIVIVNLKMNVIFYVMMNITVIMLSSM